MKILICLFVTFSSFSYAEEKRDLAKEFAKTTVKLGGKKIDVYIADSDEGRAKGLMFVREIPENTGMLFVFESEHALGFWMKNTLIPLSIGFLDKSGTLVDVQEMKTDLLAATPPSYNSAKPAIFALEMNKGWFKKNGIKVGKAKLELVEKTKSELLNQILLAPKSTRQ